MNVQTEGEALTATRRPMRDRIADEVKRLEERLDAKKQLLELLCNRPEVEAAFDLYNR